MLLSFIVLYLLVTIDWPGAANRVHNTPTMRLPGAVAAGMW
jgi:hypothetical protein